MAEHIPGQEQTVPDDKPDFGKIGKYDLEALVGEGAMGKVYRAMDPVLSRTVAIKLMSASISQDSHLRDRFLREARAAANLQHPNIITIYDFGDASGHPYIAMEYVEGTDVAHLISDRQPVSLDSKVGYVIGLLQGLAYAHTKGVVHRDIKPANLRVTADGSVKIMDFGIAHLSGSDMTHSGVVLGTPDYMAPEQVRGLPVTPQTDIWAAGALLYELLCYEKPFSGETLHAVLFKVVTEEPVSITKINPSLPDALERIVKTALHKEASRRYAAADAMAADLMSVRKHLSDLETKATLRFSRPLAALELPLWERIGRSRPVKSVVRGVKGAFKALAPVLHPVREWVRQVPVPRPLRGGSMALAASGVAVMGVGVVTLLLVAKSGPSFAEAEEPTARPIIVSDTAPSAPAAVATAPAPVPARQPPVVASTPSQERPANRTTARTSGPNPATAAAKPATATRAASEPPPAGKVDSTDTRAVTAAVTELEKAFDSRKVAQIRKLIPSMADSSLQKWEAFFKSTNRLDARFNTDDVEVSGSTATVALRATFAYRTSSGKDMKWEPRLTGTLTKLGTAWTWKGLTAK